LPPGLNEGTFGGVFRTPSIGLHHRWPRPAKGLKGPARHATAASAYGKAGVGPSTHCAYRKALKTARAMRKAGKSAAEIFKWARAA